MRKRLGYSGFIRPLLRAYSPSTERPRMSDVTPGNFQLTAEQRRFQTLLARYPRFVDYWNFESRECDLSSLNQDLGSFSHGEQILAAFLVSIWSGNDDAAFPLVDAVKTLDEDSLAVVREWLNDPFFP